MRKTSPIYRFLAAVIALVMLISISMPASLYAGETMADFCPIEMQHKAKAPMPAGHCDMPMPVEHHTSPPAQKGDMNKAMDCYFSLACTFNMMSPKNASITSPTVQAKVILTAVKLDLTAVSQPTYILNKDLLPNLSSSPPPVFLVNSTFLN